MEFARSWLYVSAAHPERFDKALSSEADAVVLDLEDSVAESHKAFARDAVVDFVSQHPDRRVVLRVNSPDSGFLTDDLLAIRSLPLGAIRVPKVRYRSDIDLVHASLRGQVANVELQPIIETAQGVVNLGEILQHGQVRRVCLGEGGLSTELRVPDRAVLSSIWMQAVVLSAAERRWSPIQGVYPNLDDEEGLQASTLKGKAMGLYGRSVIHPKQVAVVNDIFTPTPAEIDKAREVTSSLEAARSAGSGGVRLADGRFVDAPALLAAERTLRVAAAITSQHRS